MGKLFPACPKIRNCPKIPIFVDTKKYQAWNLFVDIPWLLGHGTAWDHYKMENYLHPTQKNTQLPQNTQLRRYQSFCRHPLGFWDMGQHGTNGKLPENKFLSLCQHPLALGRPGLKKNVVSLGWWWWEDVGRLRHYKIETPNPQKILPGRACNLYKIRAPNPSRNHSFLDVVKLKLYTGGWGFPFYSKKLASSFILKLGSRVRWGLPFYSDGGFCSKFVAVNMCFFKWISYLIEVHLFCDPGCFHFIEVPLRGGMGAPVLVL